MLDMIKSPHGFGVIFFMGRSGIKAVDIASVAMMTALIVVCSWIYIPVGNIPVTLQTFAVCVSVGVLGMKKGTLAVIVYLVLGIVGLPVFSFFKGGVGALLSATGGYMFGFVFLAFIAGLIIQKSGRKIPVMIFGFLIGLVACYLFGSLWFMFVYMKDTGTVGFLTVLMTCVFPYIVPDAIKITLAAVVSKAVRERIRI